MIHKEERRHSKNDPPAGEQDLQIGADEEKSAADELLGQLAKKPPLPRKKNDD